MSTVRLSRTVVAGAVITHWRATDFPENVYVALETAVGFGEGCGGVGCGSVVDALHDLESGYFFDMARIDELILNVPSRETLVSRLGAEGAESAEGAAAEWAFWREFPWEFAQTAHGTPIEWE